MNPRTITALVAVSALVAATMVASSSAAPSSSVAGQLGLARVATAKYVTDLERAKADGYQIITRMIPKMGYHFLNSKITGFNPAKPPILVYLRHGATWQLGALEWVFPTRPAKPPIQGAEYGSFRAACHYVDGTFVFANSRDKCPARTPATRRIACGAAPPESQDVCAATLRATGARFNFWHGPLVTLHLWLWYPNPGGLFADTNPLVTAFSQS